jgi:hypothetical protein
MTDWQTLHSDDLPELPEHEAAPRRLRWRGGLVAMSLLLALWAGLATLWQQRNQGRAALADDLNAVIFAEETNRLFGQAQAARFMADAPATWQQRYARTFASPPGQGLPQPAGLSALAAIDYFDGHCAVVTVSQARYDPVRAYCLADEEWQRAPIPLIAWGDESVLEPLAGLQLRFRERDRIFAERLARDLAGQTEPLPPAGLEIVLEPHDLAGPFVVAEAGRLVLNSPLLLPAATGSEPDGVVDQGSSRASPQVIHLALAGLLAGHTAASPPAARSLPGRDRFITAAQTVLALPLLVDVATQNQIREGWRAELAGDWVSPFFADFLPQPSPVTAGQAELAARLTAAYLYDHLGPELLPQLLARLPQADSWDQLLASLPRPLDSPLVSQSATPLPLRPGAPGQAYATLSLEIEAAQYAGAARVTLANLYRVYNQPFRPPPLHTKLRYLDHRSQGQPGRFPAPRVLLSPAGVLFNWPDDDDRLQGWRLFVSQSGQSEAVMVEAGPELSLTTPDGLPLSPGCVGPGIDLAIEGAWLDAPRRFQASRITAQRVHRLNPRPASNRAILLVQANPVSDGPAQLFALTADGLSRPLLDLNPGLNLQPLPRAEGEVQRLLIQSDVPTCSRSWFGLYEAGRGLIDYWFAPPRPRQWLWRPDQTRPLFVKLNDDHTSHQVYEANQNYRVGQSRLEGASYWFLGWHLADQRLVTVGFRSYGSMLGLLDPAADRMTWLANLPVRAVSPQGLSPAGDWLAYPTGVASLFGPANWVYLQRPDGQGRLTSLRFDPGQMLASLTWSPELNRPRLALLVGPLQTSDTIRPSQLLWVDPTRPQAYVEVARAGPGQQLASPIFCRNGDLLYVVEGDGRYELRRQPPGQPALTLLTLDRAIYPVICNN